MKIMSITIYNHTDLPFVDVFRYVEETLRVSEEKNNFNVKASWQDDILVSGIYDEIGGGIDYVVFKRKNDGKD